MSIYIETHILIKILVGILVLLITTIVFLLRFRKKRTHQEHIPGVKEMAKTTFFWSDYYRRKIHNK